MRVLQLVVASGRDRRVMMGRVVMWIMDRVGTATRGSRRMLAQMKQMHIARFLSMSWSHSVLRDLFNLIHGRYAVSPDG